VVGDLAYTVGVEHAEFTLAGERLRFEGRVTNVFRREADGWKIVHHHADTVPEVKAMVARLPGA
jgi:ketosteroid isomerase-like protein